ncbi:MAG: transporter substrate-binding domain-containing protein [Bacteroidetes bacterium]|nr:hypothetical protein [Bacteroidota bacterium]NOG56971.1 transporter substrate-binding domain-containing protein [Bacteroidota bacterium]
MKCFYLTFLSILSLSLFSYNDESLSLIKDSSKSAVKDTIYFGYDPDWKPFQFIDDFGNHRGIIEKVLKKVEQRSNFEFVAFKGLNWSESIAALKSGKVKLIPIINATDKRKKWMYFSKFGSKFPAVIVSRKEDEFIESIEELKGKNIALSHDYAITEEIETRYPEINIIYTNTFQESLLLLNAKKVEATIEALPVAGYYLSINGYKTLRINGDIPDITIDLKTASLIEDSLLIQKIDSIFETIPNHEYSALFNEWIDVKYEHGVNQQKVFRIAIISIIIVVLILLTGIYKNRALMREIFRRKIIENYLKTQNQEVNLENELINAKKTEILDSISYAKRIQNAILPRIQEVQKKFKKSFILYKPKDIVAGDFYWYNHKFNTNFKCLAAADCTGHGVPGAMISVICNSALNRAVNEFDLIEPGEILTKTRELVVREFEKSVEKVNDGMDIALCTLNGKTLKYAGANNPLWIIRSGGNEIEEIKAHKQSISLVDNPVPFPTHKIKVDKGDTFYIFTDGYVDQFGGPKGKKFMAPRFKNLLLNIQDKNMWEQMKILNNAFESWRGNEDQLDDVCVIGVRV